MDYIYFFYGLSFIMLAAVCFILIKKNRHELPWTWLGLFGLSHGADEWLHIIEAGLPGTSVFDILSLAFTISSFLFLIEFGRAATAGMQIRVPGRWMHALLFAVALLGILAGLKGLDAASRYTLGLAGGFWTSGVLYYAAKKKGPGAERWLIAVSTSFLLYSITLMVTVPYAPFFPASMFNSQAFLRATGVPVQLIKGLLAMSAAVSLWMYSQGRQDENHLYEPNRKKTILPVTVLLIIIVIGWVLTQFAGNYAKEEEMKGGNLFITLLANQLANEIERSGHRVIKLARSNAIIQALLTRSPGDIEKADAVLSQFSTGQETEIPSRYLLDVHGRIIAASNRSLREDFGGHLFYLRNNLLEGPLSGKFNSFYAADSTSMDRSHYTDYPVRDAKEQIIGAVVVRTNLYDIEAGLKKHPYCFLIDPHGIIFLSSRADMLLRNLWPLDKNTQQEISSTGQFGTGTFRPVMSGEAVNGDYAEMDEQQYLVIRRFLGQDRWSIIVLNPTNHIMAYRLFSIFTTFVFFSLTFAFFSALYFTKESASQIAASERRYRSLVEGAPNGVILFDRQARCLAINKAGLAMLGCAESDILGKPLDGLTSAEPGLTMEEIREKVLSGEICSFEGLKTDLNGQQMTWNSVLSPVYDLDGQIRHFVGIFTDITERKRAENELQRYKEHLEDIVKDRTVELSDTNLRLNQQITERILMEDALRDSEKRFHSLFNLASDCIFLLDPTYESGSLIIDANISACSMHGYTREELIGKPIRFLDTIERQKISLDVMPRMMSGEAVTFEIDHVRKDGTVLPVEVAAQLIHIGGNPYILAIDRDITERKLAEEELRRHREHLVELVEERTIELKATVQLLTKEIAIRKSAEETLKENESKFRKLSQEFNTLLDAIPDSLLLLSPELKVMWANKAALSGLGVNEDLAGRFCHDLWHHQPVQCEDCAAKKSFRSSRAESSQISTPDGRLLDLKAYPIYDDDRRANNVIIVASDITEKTTLQAEAMRASHLASLGELAAGVAHEINNPINGIINYAQILFNRSTRDSRESDVANRIIREGDRIAGIVRSLLSFARERKEEKIPVNLQKILLETITLTEAQIRKDGITLKIDIPSDLPDILANPQQIQQVFLNIISNARYALNKKYPGVHENKTLEVSGKKISAAGRTHIQIMFLDRGAGIPADIIDKVMNPFFSTKSSGEGTGLGLSISHGIIKDHDGILVLNSIEGRFTKVMIDLPAKETRDR